MMKKHFIIFLFLLLSGLIFSQKKKKKKLETEEITVVKAYSPTVADAFKIRTEPSIDSVEIYSKIEMEYSINSIPVASTFIPAKGKAKTIRRAPRERFYQNYITAGYGNFNTPLVEIFAHSNSSKYNDFGGFFKYQASKGGIDDILLDDNYSDVKLDLFYKQTERYFDWQANGGINNQINNWYGLSEDINFKKDVLNSIEEKQGYTEIYLGGDIEFFDALIHRGNVEFSSFLDKKGSMENQGYLSGIVDFPVGQEMIYTEMTLDFLTGKFDSNFLQTDKIKYTFFNIGLHPNFEVLRDNLTVNIGAKLYYSFTDTSDGSKFYAYPNITASYEISNEEFIAYAGVVGDLEQNSYKNFAKENPFVSPTLDIKRTSQQYNGYIGVKGLWNSNIRFNAKVAYGNESDKPFFKLNPSKTDGKIKVEEGYEAGNSFDVVYDDVNTIHASGEVIFDFNKEFKFGGNIEFNSYNLSIQDEAWNLPLLKSTLIVRYSKKKWNAGANLFFASDRKDELIILPLSTSNRITNSTYFDINLNGLFHINDKFSVFANLNNLLSDNYERYTYFKVQGFQFLVGGRYQFDL